MLTTDPLAPPGFTRGSVLSEGDDTGMKRFAWSPNGDRIAVGYKGRTIGVWQVDGGPAWDWGNAHGRLVTSVAWSPNGPMLASGSDDRTVRIWDTETGKPKGPILRGHRGHVTNVAWSPQGTMLASCSDDKNVRVWNVEDGGTSLPVQGEHEARILSIAWSPNGKMLASASWDKTVGLWLWKSGTLILDKRLPGNPDDVYCVAWSYDGQFLASGGKKHTIVIRDDRCKVLKYLNTRRHIVTSISFSRDNKLLASKATDGIVRLWDCSTWEEIAVLPADGTWPYTTVAFHPHRSDVFAAAAAQDSEVQLWFFDRNKVHEPKPTRQGGKIFIGHGRSPLWMQLKDFLQNRLHLEFDEFNRIPVPGFTTADRLSQMLDAGSFAFIVMTGEDENADRNIQPRMNVVHEAGLFQGRLGFHRAIILIEEGCAEFSNILGLSQIRFPRGEISAVFDEIRKVLEREGIVKSH